MKNQIIIEIKEAFFKKKKQKIIDILLSEYSSEILKHLMEKYNMRDEFKLNLFIQLIFKEFSLLKEIKIKDKNTIKEELFLRLL